MDTGCPSLLMPLPHPTLHRKRPSPAPTLEIARRLGIKVAKAAAVLTNVAGATDLREIDPLQGVTAIARGLPLDLDVPRGTDTIEMLHPGGEIKPYPPP